MLLNAVISAEELQHHALWLKRKPLGSNCFGPGAVLLPVIESWIKVSGFFSFLLEIARATFIQRHERSSSALTDGRKETWKIRKKYGQWSGKRETESSTLYFSTVFYPTSSTSFSLQVVCFFSFVTICFFSNILSFLLSIFHSSFC